MTKLRAGVVGLGWGRRHLQEYAAHSGARVVAVCDADPLRREVLAREFEVPERYGDWRRMLESERLDVLSIASPNHLHRVMTVEALEAGCHVICEKPLGLHADEVRTMVTAAGRTGRRLMVDFSFRFREPARAIRRQIDAGRIGDPYFVRSVWHRRSGIPGLGGWFGVKAKSGGGALIDLGIHRLDLACWFLGSPRPTTVLGATYDPFAARIARERGVPFDVEDLACAMVRFQNGASLVLEASWASGVQEAQLMETRVLGTDGGVVQRNRGGGYDLEAELYRQDASCRVDIRLEPPWPDTGGPVEHFVDCIREDRPHMATGEDALLVAEILDAIYESARTGRAVDLSPSGA